MGVTETGVERSEFMQGDMGDVVNGAGVEASPISWCNCCGVENINPDKMLDSRCIDFTILLEKTKTILHSKSPSVLSTFF